MEKNLTKFLTVVATVISLNLTAYELIDYQDPKEGEQREFYIGDKIFVSTSGNIMPCIIPMKQFKIEKKSLTVTQSAEYKRRVPICKKTKNSKFYEPNYSNYLSQGSFSKTTRLTLNVSVKEKKLGWNMCVRFSGINMFCAKELSDTELKIDDEYFVHSPEYSVKSVTYLGKSKGIIKFTYEEVFDSFYNPIFRTYLGGDSQTLQFEVDPNESKIFSFKGAVFEIIEESSAMIKIKVIRGFPI